jgi:hypothetical protein
MDASISNYPLDYLPHGPNRRCVVAHLLDRNKSVASGVEPGLPHLAMVQRSEKIKNGDSRT